MPKGVHMSELIAEISENTGFDTDTVVGITDELLLQLHRRFVEYNDGNCDVIGEDLWNQLSSQAFYHLLGLLERFNEHYVWEPGSANEYLARLGSQVHWLPYRHQTVGWKRAR